MTSTFSNLENIQFKLMTILDDSPNQFDCIENNTKTDMKNSWEDFTSARELLDNVNSTHTFLTGIPTIDNLLSSPKSGYEGFIEGHTYEIAGESRTGKTQLCHQICIAVQLNKSDGGLEKKAIYIDTEKNFSPSRIHDLSHGMQYFKGIQLDIKTILQNIMIACPSNSQQLVKTIEKIVDFLLMHPNEFGLIVIDSITSLFRSEYKLANKYEQQETMIKLLHLLGTIARVFDLAVVVTNQMAAKINQSENEDLVPAKDHIISQWVNHRIRIKYLSRNRRMLELMQSKIYPSNACLFSITTDGLVSEN